MTMAYRTGDTETFNKTAQATANLYRLPRGHDRVQFERLFNSATLCDFDAALRTCVLFVCFLGFVVQLSTDQHFGSIVPLSSIPSD